MVLAVALGIAVCTVTFTDLPRDGHQPDPVEERPALRGHGRHLGPGEALRRGRSRTMPPALLTYRDATAPAAVGHRRSAAPIMFKSDARARLRPARARSRSAPCCASPPADFFALFDVPFQYGSGWDRRGRPGPGAGRRAEPRDQREGVRRREQRRPHGAARTTTNSASSACSTTGRRARSSTT